MRFFFLIFLLANNCLCRGQISSFDVSGSSAMIHNLGYRLNGTRDLMLRFNQKIGWYFSGHFAVAYNVTRFNTMPKEYNHFIDLRNVYTGYQLGGNFNLSTAIRTYRKGGRSAVGLIEISHAHFKLYLCAGVELLKLKKTEDTQSFHRTINVFEGAGVEVYRIGKKAYARYQALVPFFECRYFQNTDGGYYSSPNGFVSFNKWVFSAGFKFTYGLKG